MSLGPSDEIHYVALLGREAETLQIIPMREPLVVPANADENWITADVSLRLTLSESAER